MPYSDPAEKAACQQRSKERRRARCLDYLGGKCAVCGTTEDLEFHHKDPASKKFVVGRSMSWVWEKVVPELDKCELRCREHHAEIHGRQHGSRYLFREGCRCDLCVERQRTWNREYKRKRRAVDPSYGH